MKFSIKVLLKGKYCFLFTPVIMLLLLISVKLNFINAKSEVPSWLGSFLDWRYSEESFFLPLLIGFVISLLISILIQTQGLTFKEKIRLGKFFDFFAYVVSNIIMFMAGVMFAWSFSSPFIDFVDPIRQQEIMVPYMLFAAIVFHYGVIKFKHYQVKG